MKKLSSERNINAPLLAAAKKRIVTNEYELTSRRIPQSTRLCILSDLHCARYGEGQSDLVAAVEAGRPDAVLLLGDLFDQRVKNANTETLLSALAQRYPCYFIFGNHEHKSGDLPNIFALLRKYDIPVLAGTSALVAPGIRVFGVDDLHGGRHRQLRQIEAAAARRSQEEFSILAVHVPNGVESYLRFGFDLMLSGHTHGGQIIVPGVFNGLYAPGQGFFPKYGGGRYDLGPTTLIVSRGLAQKPVWLPRFGNPPELAVISLQPEKT